MKIPHRQRKFGLTFNITPLIDIVFLLIIFFLAASHLVRSDASSTVELPRAAETDDDNEQPRRIVITVNAQGEMIVAGNTITLPELEDLLRAGRQKQGGEEFEVRIRPDKRVPYKHIEPIMTACVRQGITEFGFQVLPK